MKKLLLLLPLVLLFSCEPSVEPNKLPAVTRRVCKVLKAKHLEHRSTNYRGDFEVMHYFLYEDGTLEEVNLRDYMSFNSGDTLCWDEYE